MIVLLRPGIRFVERLSVVANLSVIAVFYLAAELLTLWWATRISPSGSLNGDMARAAAGWAPWGILALFIGGTYALTSFVVSFRINLERISRALGRIAAGEIGAQERQTAVATTTESTVMWGALAQMRENLGGIVTQVRDSAETIARGSREMSDSYSNLSQRTEEQASTLEQTASGMEHLSETVQRNANHCKDAADLAQTALAAAQQGAAAFQHAEKSMAAVEAGSKRMADITGVIEGIAFQTNILALNAAVEAARAGDQGRGFAVVASEVRALAQRSGDAAKQIKGLIGQTVSQITEGSRNAATAGNGIDRIVASVGKVTQLIGEVAAASSEQSAGVGELNKAITQLESVTQQNAALVEQAAAAAENFQEESTRMLGVVGAFKLDRTEARDQAVALVKKAAAHLAKAGPRQAFADFHDSRAGFMFDDYYVFALDMNCMLHANGAEPETCGADHSGNIDADGKRFSLELVDVARTRGRGWVDYRRVNRRSGQIEAKSSYVERVGDFLVGCGIYRIDRSAPPAATPASLAAPQARRLTGSGA
jgi:methyl-accepting chemotaxis protein